MEKLNDLRDCIIKYTTALYQMEILLEDINLISSEMKRIVSKKVPDIEIDNLVSLTSHVIAEKITLVGKNNELEIKNKLLREENNDLQYIIAAFREQQKERG